MGDWWPEFAASAWALAVVPSAMAAFALLKAANIWLENRRLSQTLDAMARDRASSVNRIIEPTAEEVRLFARRTVHRSAMRRAMTLGSVLMAASLSVLVFQRSPQPPQVAEAPGQRPEHVEPGTPAETPPPPPPAQPPPTPPAPPVTTPPAKPSGPGSLGQSTKQSGATPNSAATPPGGTSAEHAIQRQLAGVWTFSLTDIATGHNTVEDWAIERVDPGRFRFARSGRWWNVYSRGSSPSSSQLTLEDGEDFGRLVLTLDAQEAPGPVTGIWTRGETVFTVKATRTSP